VSAYFGQPQVQEALIGVGILLGSYLLARLLSFLVGRLLGRAARRTLTSLDDQLIVAVKRPLTSVLFLLGAAIAAERLPLGHLWRDRVDRTLYVLGVAVVALAASRTLRILIGWYASTPGPAGSASPAQFAPLLQKLSRLLIGVLAVIAVCEHLGVNVQSLVVSLGVGSLAVGLAAQDTLANLIAGFTLALDRPFAIGERIQLANGEVGDVEAIGMRVTRIRTPDETLLIIPNAVLVKEKMVNQSRPDRAMTTRLEVGVAYGTDLAQARQLLEAAARACPRVDPDRSPIALVVRFAESQVQLRLVFWVRDFAEQGLALSEIHESVWRGFAGAGIEIPYPVRRLVRDPSSA
jgi:MscS family membrane protein